MTRFKPQVLSMAEVVKRVSQASGQRASHATSESRDRGRLLTAKEVAAQILQGKMSVRWVIDRMAGDVGYKPGREWLFYENDAREWWVKYLERISHR